MFASGVDDAVTDTIRGVAVISPIVVGAGVSVVGAVFGVDHGVSGCLLGPPVKNERYNKV